MDELTRLNRQMVAVAKRRRELIVKLVAAGMSYAEVGRKLGISRERVRQIAARMNGGTP